MYFLVVISNKSFFGENASMPLYAERETPMSRKPKPEVPDMHHVFVSVESTVTFVLSQLKCRRGPEPELKWPDLSRFLRANFEILGAHESGARMP